MVLIFMFEAYYPSGGMNDCVFIADSIESANQYVLETDTHGYIEAFRASDRTTWSWSRQSKAFLPEGVFHPEG